MLGLEKFPVLVLVPLLVTAIVPPHNWSWVHSSIHLSDLVLVLGGGRANKLGCEDETLLTNSVYSYRAMPCITMFHFPITYCLFVALC